MTPLLATQSIGYISSESSNEDSLRTSLLATEVPVITSTVEENLNPENMQPNQPSQVRSEGIIFQDGSLYSGPFRDGLPHGTGIRILPNKNVFVGFFENGQMKRGRLFLLFDEYFEGTFRDGRLWDGYHANKNLVLRECKEGQWETCCECTIL